MCDSRMLGGPAMITKGAYYLQPLHPVMNDSWAALRRWTSPYGWEIFLRLAWAVKWWMKPISRWQIESQRIRLTKKQQKFVLFCVFILSLPVIHMKSRGSMNCQTVHIQSMVDPIICASIRIIFLKRMRWHQLWLIHLLCFQVEILTYDSLIFI